MFLEQLLSSPPRLAAKFGLDGDTPPGVASEEQELPVPTPLEQSSRFDD